MGLLFPANLSLFPAFRACDFSPAMGCQYIAIFSMMGLRSICELHTKSYVVASLQGSKMPRSRDDPPTVRVYTICDESKYLIVRNVPALGCGDDLAKLFGSYGEIEECKPMDAEVCEPFTDIYWIKYSKVSSARFAKRKLDESTFFGNKLQISYATDFESLSDTQDKLESRRMEVLSRIKYGSKPHTASKRREQEEPFQERLLNHVSSNQDYFPSSSMNATVRFVRSKLDKVESSSEHGKSSLSKKTPLDNRRRI